MTWSTDIQANILRGLPAANARYLFLAFDNRDDLREFVRTVLRSVRSADWQRDRFPDKSTVMDHAILNLAFTRQGIELALGLGPGQGYRSDERRRRDIEGLGPLLQEADAFAWRAEVPHPFTPGMVHLDPNAVNTMYRRLDLLGEAPIFPAPDTWQWDPTALIHALAWISGPNPVEVGQLAAEVLAAPGHLTLDRANEPLDIRASRRPGDVDPFGFRDGVNQPAVHGFHNHREVFGRGAVTPDGWRGIKPGEFIVGEEDEGGERRRPLPADILHNSTYLVFRQIRMWRNRLDDLLMGHEQPVGVAEDTMAGWFAGRHRPGNGNEGTSLMVQGPKEDRDFLYGADPEGLLCPLGAHIRRANPRDALGKEGRRSVRHRIIRRGMPYQKTNWLGQVIEEGLAFIALQARIEDQFEFIQAHWLNVGPTLHAGQDPDPIAGNATADVAGPRFVRQGAPAAVIGLPRQPPNGPVSRVLGGEYFVMPTLTGLSRMLD